MLTNFTYPCNQYPDQISEHSQTAKAPCVPFRSLPALQGVATMLASNDTDECASSVLTVTKLKNQLVCSRFFCYYKALKICLKYIFVFIHLQKYYIQACNKGITE